MVFSTRRLLLSASLPVLSLAAALSIRNETIYQPRPYKVDVDPAFIEEIRVKASHFRPSIELDQPAWEDGPPAAFINEVADYWANEFDWFEYQDQINENFTQYMTTIPAPGGNYSLDLDIHFIHQKSSRPDAIPILFLHGWPSTNLEWRNVIHPLVNPPNASLPAFHVVAPDLPGFGFSPATTKPGLGPLENARVFASLMSQLGYERFALYSTDLGFAIAQAMVPDAAIGPRIINHVVDMYLVFPTAEDLARQAAGETTEEENTYINGINTFFTRHAAYSQVHSTFPLSAAYAFNDSPVGFAAWMYQLVYTGIDVPQTPLEVIERAMGLYLPGVYGNIRSYKELFGFFSAPLTSVPTSIIQGGIFGGYPAIQNVNFVPREWIERTANLTYFSRHPIGGHFPAETQPQLVLEDLWKIFS